MSLMCVWKNKNYKVVKNAGWARSRNTLKINSSFFLIDQSIDEQSVSRMANPPFKTKMWRYRDEFSLNYKISVL